MYIDRDKCVGCKRCAPYCPVSAILPDGKTYTIDLDACVECSICLKFANCPRGAIYRVELEAPRAYRRAFSDPQGKHTNTPLQHAGRGTEEVKTNDVTGVMDRLDQIAFAVELGRPGVSASFRDVERVAKAVAPYALHFEVNNPVTSMIVNKSTGEMDPTVLGERVLSAIVEFSVALDSAHAVLESLKAVAREIDTVFSLCIISRVDERDNSLAVLNIIEDLGLDIDRASAKTNLGLGRPRYEERVRRGEA